MKTNPKNPTNFERMTIDELKKYYEHPRQAVFVTAIRSTENPNRKVAAIPTAFIDKFSCC